MEITEAQRALLLRALSSFRGDVEAGVIDDPDEEFEDDLEALGALLAQQPEPGLPPIVYADEATQSWLTHLDNLAAYAWRVQVTFADGRTADAVIREARFSDETTLAQVTFAYYDDQDNEPDETTETETVFIDQIALIRVY